MWLKLQGNASTAKPLTFPREETKKWLFAFLGKRKQGDLFHTYIL
jgi:hypothetical protein